MLRSEETQFQNEILKYYLKCTKIYPKVAQYFNVDRPSVQPEWLNVTLLWNRSNALLMSNLHEIIRYWIEPKTKLKGLEVCAKYVSALIPVPPIFFSIWLINDNNLFNLFSN